jgi:Tfp pilus assembly protein PilF
MQVPWMCSPHRADLQPAFPAVASAVGRFVLFCSLVLTAGLRSFAQADSHNNLGLKFLAEGNLDRAAAEFELAAASTPQSAEALGNLAVVLARQGKKVEAEKSLRDAIQRNPLYEDAHLNLGLLLANQNRLGEAKFQVEKAIAIAPGDPRAYAALGNVQTKLDEPDAGVQSFKKAVELDPLSPDAHLNLGLALAAQSGSRQALLKQALGEFSQAARLAPGLVAARYHRGRALFNLARYTEAEPELETAVKLQPSDPAALYVLALTEAQLGRTARSSELLARVIALDSSNAKTHYFLGLNLLHQGSISGALAQWQKAIEIDPEDEPSLYNLALALRKTDSRTAEQYSIRYQELQNRHRITKLAESARLAAQATAEKGNWRAAAEQLRQAVAVCGECSLQWELRKSLGLAYCYADDLSNGERELRRFLQHEPGDLDARQAMEIIGYLKHQGRVVRARAGAVFLQTRKSSDFSVAGP